MEVASLELARTLYELSGQTWITRTRFSEDEITPMYGLGFLLRKLLPLVTPDGDHCVYLFLSGGWYTAEYQVGGGHRKEWIRDADTPENATAQLCIELFKQKILVKENINE